MKAPVWPLIWALIWALSLGAAAPALGQSLPIRLEDGASWTFVARHDHEVDGAEARRFSVTTAKRLTWHGAADGPGRIRMEPISVTANAGLRPEAASAQTLDIPIEFDVDRSLAPNGVRNPAELRAATAALFLRSGGSAEEMQRMTSEHPEVVDRTAMSLAGRELGLLARAQGVRFKSDLPIYDEDEVPNPLGGPPIRSRITYALEAFDAAAGRAVVVWRAGVEPQAVRDSLMEAVGRLPADRQPQAEARLASVRLDDDRSCRNEIDIATGLALKVACVTKVTVVTGETTVVTTDRWTIDQTLPGKP